MSAAGRRVRLGRTDPRVLRQIDGDSPAVAQHSAPPVPHEDHTGGAEPFVVEYDDGNGMWIHGVSL